MRKQQGIIGALLAIGLAMYIPVAPAEAAFPGLNGRIAFHSTRADGMTNEIYTMKMDGSGLTRLTTNSANDNFARWSSDGKKIVFETTRDGNTEIYTMNADGTNPVNISNNSALDNRGSWSPDGAKIIFASNRSGNYEIYTVDSDGSDLTNITNNSGIDTDPAWSPDGTKIAFISNRDGNSEIFVMDTDGTNIQQLTNSPGSSNAVDWSPDGAKIAFFSNRSGNNDFYTMNSDGTDQMNITNNPAADIYGGWLADGSKLVFRTARDGNDEIYSVNPDGSALQRLTDNTFHDSGPSVQPLTLKPSLTDDTATVSGGLATVNVLANDSDNYESLDSNTLSIQSVTNGSAVASTDGTITFTPLPGFNGSAQVTYRVCSTANSALCSNGTLTMQVLGASTLAPTGTSLPGLIASGLAILGGSVLLGRFALRRI